MKSVEQREPALSAPVQGGGGWESGCGRLLSVTMAIGAGTCRQGGSGWTSRGSKGPSPPPPPSKFAGGPTILTASSLHPGVLGRRWGGL